ncbi:glutamyl-tRNA(Gln) amidotransferase subunit A, mitochondrial-like [Ornithodoros turicata]|uniref:glutamyl-tRNA(Gln) amidotransferase subunit A, mitochondrial-like n=1 Tax=Ornithodoros turicata TaxID=34597 RepID=UPI00313A082A
MLSLTIKELASNLRSRRWSPSDVYDSCLKQIEAISPLNAFVTVAEGSQAVESQQRWERKETLGVLDGVPIAVKDNFCIKGVRTTCASKMLANFCPPYTATVVEKLRQKGAVIVGKTNMDEFGMGSGGTDSVFGPTKNPWKACTESATADDDWYIPGGSSGGSAVAVATGASYGALGSDTGGSTRNPASRCGVVGLKPTYGTVSRHGLIPLTNSMDVPGILAKCVDDAAILYEAMAGFDPLDSTTVQTRDEMRDTTLSEEPSVSGVRVGIPAEYYCEGMSSETLDTWREIADILDRLGAVVSPVSLPHSRYSTECYSVLNACEVASNFARYDGIEFGHRAEDESSTEALYAATRHEGFNEVVRGRILAGNYFLLRKNYDQFFNKALKVRRLICEDFDKVFQSGIDLLLTPVTLTEAVKQSEWYRKDNRQRASVEDFCTQPVNMAGLPAVSVPCRLSAQGLPLSLQLIGQRFCEPLMLNVAKRIEMEVMFPRLDTQIHATGQCG